MESRSWGDVYTTQKNRILELEAVARGLQQCCEEYRSEIAALREAVREAYETMESCGHDNWCDWSVVRRALEEKP